MDRITIYTIALAMACLLHTPAWAQDDTSTPETAHETPTALLASAGLDLPTLLLANQVLQLVREDQAGFENLLSELTTSGDLSEEGAAEMRAWLVSASADYVALLSPANRSSAANPDFIGPLLPADRTADSRQAGNTSSPHRRPGEPIGHGISLSADGTVQVQGVEQLLGLAGLGQVAEAASAAGVIMEIDAQNVGVYIPLTMNGKAVGGGQAQLSGVSAELQELLTRLQPDARVYTVPKAWREDAGAAWNYLRELVTGKQNHSGGAD